MANIVELRSLTDGQLVEMLSDAREEMFNLRFQKSSGTLENTNRLRVVRREIAQLNEVMGKRKWAVREAAEHPDVASLLEGVEWHGEANYVYEVGGWQVKLLDADGNELANVLVDLNKKRRSTRRARDNRAPVQKIVNVEVAG